MAFVRRPARASSVVSQRDVDVLYLQETKAQESPALDRCTVPARGLSRVLQDAGTRRATAASRSTPGASRTGARSWLDAVRRRGRYIEARFGKLSVVSFYIPSGTSGEERQAFKFQAMDWLKPIFDQWLASGRDYVLCGDWNIVRSERDIRNWKSNQKNSGCLPRERAGSTA